jgi:glycosyltransferase involved in cell wall biosynthesis
LDHKVLLGTSTPDKCTNVPAADSPPPNNASVKRALFIVITDDMGGAERVIFSLASELALRPGWSVEVVMASSELPNSAARQLLPPQVRIRYGPWRSWYSSFAILPFRLALKRYDLVVTTQIYTNALLSCMRRWKLISIGRLVARESSSLFDWTAGLKRQLFEGLYRVYGQEDLLIAQTRYMAEHVRRVLPTASAERLRVLPNPVNVKTIAAASVVGLDKNLRELIGAAPAILLCGRLIARKNPLLALAVFHQIASRNLRSQLVFVGDGPLETQLREEALRLDILDRVLFLGRLKNPYPVMAACQYGLLTSTVEGFPNVVLEMMACGLRKIVVTPCAGDLHDLPGVTATRTFQPAEIADALGAAIEMREDQSAEYRSAAASRSVRGYLDSVLGGTSEAATRRGDGAQ